MQEEQNPPTGDEQTSDVPAPPAEPSPAAADGVVDTPAPASPAPVEPAAQPAEEPTAPAESAPAEEWTPDYNVEPNDPTDKPNAGDAQGGVAVDVLETFELNKPAPSDLFAVMDASGVEASFSTEQPLRGHQLAFKGRNVDLSTIHEIENVKRQAAQQQG